MYVHITWWAELKCYCCVQFRLIRIRNTVYYYNFDLLIAFSRFPDEYEYDRGVHSFPFHTHSIHQQRKDIQLCLFRYCSHSNAYKIENKQTFTHLIYRNNIIQFMSVDKSTKNEAIFFFILHHCRIARMKKQTFFVFHFYYFLIFVLLTYTCLNNEKVAHSCKYWLKPNVNNFVSISLKNKKTNEKKLFFLSFFNKILMDSILAHMRSMRSNAMNVIRCVWRSVKHISFHSFLKPF